MRLRTIVIAIAGLIAGLLVVASLRMPRITGWNPESTEIRAGQSIVIETNIPVELESLEDHFEISPSLLGTLEVGDRSFVFSPDSPLEYGQRVLVTIAAGVKAESGLPTLKTYQKEFSVGEPEIIYLLENNGIVNLWKVDVSGESTQITDELNGIWDFSILPSRDGFLVSAIDEDGSDELVRVLLNEEQISELECDAHCRHGRWQPKGSMIAFERSDIGEGEGRPEVWLLDSASGELMPGIDFIGLSEGDIGAGISQYPGWSADGRFLSFYQPDIQRIVIHDMQDGDSHLIPAIVDIMGDWSPTANQLAYTELTFNESETSPSDEGAGVIDEPSIASTLRVVDTDQARVIDLDSGRSNLYGLPVWSPDGSKLAFSQALDGNRQIWSIPLDGSKSEALTDNSSYNHTSPSWSPDGRHIIFMRSAIDGSGDAKGVWILELNDGEPQLLVDDAFLPMWLP